MIPIGSLAIPGLPVLPRFTGTASYPKAPRGTSISAHTHTSIVPRFVRGVTLSSTTVNSTYTVSARLLVLADRKIHLFLLLLDAFLL